MKLKVIFLLNCESSKYIAKLFSLSINFGAQKNHLNETVLLSTHNICFTKTILKSVFYSIFAFFFKQKPYTKGVVLSFCPNSNQSPTKKGGLLYFCPYFIKSPTKKGVFTIFVLILTRVLTKRTLSSIFALILTKTLPKMCFFSLFCPYSNQSPVTKSFFSLNFALILTKALP